MLLAFAQKHLHLLALLDFMQKNFVVILDLPAHDIERLRQLRNFIMFCWCNSAFGAVLALANAFCRQAQSNQIPC